MKRKLSMYIKSTLVRYMLSYVLIIMLLVLCIMVFTFSYYRDSMYETTVAYEINKLAVVGRQYESYARTLTAIAEQLSLSPDCKPFTFSEKPENAYSLIQAIKPYTITTDFCDQIYVIFHDDDTLYSSSSSVKLDMFTDTVMLYENVAPDALGAMLREKSGVRVIPCQGVKNALLDGSSTRMLTYIIPLGASRAGSAGNAVCYIPESKLKNVLEDEVGELRNRYILYKSEIIASSESFALDARSVIGMASGASGGRIAGIDGEEYLFIGMTGDGMGFSYLSAMPLKSVYRAAANVWLSFTLVLLSFAVPCIAFAVWLSRHNYRPIREMSTQFGEGHLDDLLAIREGISDLVYKNRALDTQLEKSLPARKIHFVQNLVKGRFTSSEDAVAAAEALGLDIDLAYFAIILIGASDGARLEDMIRSAPKEISCAGTDLLAHEQTLIVAFSNDSRLLRKFAQSLCDFDAIRNNGVPVAISDAHDDIRNMPTAYLEATSAYENRFVMGDNRLLCFADISFAARSVSPAARGQIDAIKRALSGASVDEMNAQIDELLMFLRTADMSLFAFRQVYNEVIGAILAQIADDADEKRDSLKYYDLFTLSNCRTIDELDGILRSVCVNVMGGERENDRPLIRNIIAQMTARYADASFSLTGLADEFGLSTTRLSLEFKETMRMTPSDYLTMLRMEHSKKLLRQTETSIKDICAAVGYYDVSSFIRRFKQYAGITPVKYRQNSKMGDNKNEVRPV